MKRERKLIVLTTEQRQELERFTKTGEHSARLIRRASIILQLDTSEGRKAKCQEAIAKDHSVCRKAVTDARSAFLAADSVSSFLKRKKRETPPIAPKITGEVEAKIIALACSVPPQGYCRWTLKLIASKAVELRIIGSISDMSVHHLLKKRNLSLT